MTERHGVQIGQRVRDLDGRSLGRVRELYETGFSAEKGFPVLFRSELVAGYDEVREVGDGEVVLARSQRDLLDLARGELPPSWRIHPPPNLPAAATPPEARLELAGAVPAPGAALEP